MAIANLHETLLNYKLRRNQLNLEITCLQSQKTVAISSQGDKASVEAQQKRELKEYYRSLYENDEDLKAEYKDYTEIPDFEDAIDKIEALYTDEIADISAWEEQIDAQIRTDSTELEEVNAYIDSLKSVLSSNIQSDFNYGLNK